LAPLQDQLDLPKKNFYAFCGTTWVKSSLHVMKTDVLFEEKKDGQLIVRRSGMQARREGGEQVVSKAFRQQIQDDKIPQAIASCRRREMFGWTCVRYRMPANQEKMTTTAAAEWCGECTLGISFGRNFEPRVAEKHKE
jgi:hypothetical protein